MSAFLAGVDTVPLLKLIECYNPGVIFFVLKRAILAFTLCSLVGIFSKRRSFLFLSSAISYVMAN